jgi:hypothetical protein
MRRIASGRSVGSSVLLALVIALLGMMQQAAPALAAAPPNDAFAAAQPLSGTSTTVSGTTVGATLEPGEPNHFTQFNGSVWYSWTAPETSVVSVDTCGPVYTNVQMYRGPSVGSLVEVVSRLDAPDCAAGIGIGNPKAFNVVAGSTYEISVTGGHSYDPGFTLRLSATPTPSNDDFATPQDLGDEPNVEVDGDTTGTTLQPGEQDYSEGEGGYYGSVWYRWTALRDMRVWIDNCNAASDSLVTVYTGTELASLKVNERVGELRRDREPFEITACDGFREAEDAQQPFYGGREEFLVTAGTTYMIRVSGAAGAFHLRTREIVFDDSVSQSASATKIKKGKTVTYTADIQNEGTIPSTFGVSLFATQPDALAKPVVGTKYLSITSTSGKCGRVSYGHGFPGAICVPGELAPGDSVRIVAKVRPSQSLSHWIDINYGGGDRQRLLDDNPANDPVRGHTTTLVKQKHHH